MSQPCIAYTGRSYALLVGLDAPDRKGNDWIKKYLGIMWGLYYYVIWGIKRSFEQTPGDA